MKNALFIVSAPSGAGKTSLIKATLEHYPEVVLSISHTTRLPRSGEIDGKDYHFVDTETFKHMVKQGAFLEYAQVYDNFYGTSEVGVRKQLAQGQHVILEIDWQGARQVRDAFPDAISVFIAPPTIEELHKRLSLRGQDSKEVIKRRMKEALLDLSHYAEYEHIIINDDFNTAIRELSSLIEGQPLDSESGRKLIRAILES